MLWAFDPSHPLGGLLLSDDTTLGGTDKPTLTVRPEGLPSAGSVSFLLTLLGKVRGCNEGRGGAASGGCVVRRQGLPEHR
jgi:hypothetical protein